MADDKPRPPLPPEVAETPVRNDMDDGLRFLHVMGMQIKHDLFESSTKLMALLEELMATGGIDGARLDERRQKLMQDEYTRVQKDQVHVQIADATDKYAIVDMPDIDCEARRPLCKARCCKLHFPLSFQDLDERVVQWEYGLPYVNRKRASDKLCVHNEEGRCGVYEHRPAVCRTYTCKTDKRIWLDFEKRIPAPEDDKLYELRTPMKQKPTP